MSLEYRIELEGVQFVTTRFAQKDASIRASLVRAQHKAESELEVHLRIRAPRPRSAAEVQGHGIHVDSHGTERFAGSVKGGGTAVSRTMRLEVSLEDRSVASYIESGTGIYHEPIPRSGYTITREPGGPKLGPWAHNQGGVSGQDYSAAAGGFLQGVGVAAGDNANLVWADSVFIPGTRPHPWIQDAFDEIKLHVEDLYRDAVHGAV